MGAVARDAIALVLWDDRIIHDLKIGNNLQIRNGFVALYRGEWRINVGKYSEIKRNIFSKKQVNF